MKFDRNTVLGFVILAALFFGYFYYNNQQIAASRKQKAEIAKKEQAIIDSVAKINQPKEDSLKRSADSAAKVNLAKNFQLAPADTTEELASVENELIKVTFTNKGGQVKKVELKKFKGQDSNLVKLAASDFNKISYTINTTTAGAQETGNLYFSKAIVTKGADNSQVVSFKLQTADSTGNAPYIVHEFVVKPDEYMIDFNVKMSGADKFLQAGNMNLTWQYAAAQQEAGVSFEKQNTQVGYVEDGDFDYHTIAKTNDKTFKDPVSWVGVRQRFFFTSLVAKDNFSSGKIEWVIPADSTKTIVQSTANMKLSVKAGAISTIPFSIYYGPSDYHVLIKYDKKFGKMLNLGQGMYSFVRPINKYVIIPIFDFLKSLTGNMGIAIALLTLFIKLLTSPLLYKSYLSGAKMKLLRPEIAKLKEKHGDDRQAMSMDQMKLFREAGVNPLGGCIPALLQIPIFFALFSLFNSDVGLRGHSFLWAADLSAPDYLIHIGNIPGISYLLGDHISLFNITAVITSFLISLYSMSMTPDQSNPMMKYLPYIFPVFLLFFFNRLPSALTWYYTVSNIITLALQFIIQTYIINHDKIMAKIEENRKKPKGKSKWQERMEQMQDQQKKMKEMQQKNKR